MRGRRWVAAALLAAAVALIGLGIYTGEPEQVAQKAVSVCFECIGVG